jgi:uncharacterized protein (DUF2236 family)
MTARVRRIHATKRGTLPEAVGRFPAGTPWAADDPELLLWILSTLADSAWIVYERYVGRLTEAEKDAYWADMRVMGSLFGLGPADMPRTSAELSDYVEQMIRSDALHVSEMARELGIRIVMRPPVPLPVRPLLELANFVTVGLLPARIRREYRLGWDPVRALTLRAGQEYTRRLVVPVLPRRLRYGSGRTRMQLAT